MAESLVEQLKGSVGRTHRIEAIELVPSGGGVFDVLLDGERVFSKSEQRRFPESGEIEQLVRRRT